MMKTSWGKPVSVISFIRTLLIVLTVAVCLATLMGCGNSPVEDRIKKLHKAAEQGDAKAQNSLGVMYGNGHYGVADPMPVRVPYRAPVSKFGAFFC